MKILYDYQIFEAQEFGGISRYFAELIKRNENAQVSLRYSNNFYIKQNDRYKEILFEKDYHRNKFLKGVNFRGKNRMYEYYKKINSNKHQSNKEISEKALLDGNFDIFHPTYFDKYFLEKIGNKPFIVTIYDMIHEIYPELFNMNDETSEFKKKIALKANKIIAISETTKNDIINIFGIKEDKISVIHLGSNLLKEKSEEIQLPNNFILFIGTRWGYKNFSFFLSSIAELLNEYSSLYLVCIGPNFTKEEHLFFKRHNIANKILQFSALESNLFQYYSKAACFVFPSYYEGFGIPILEAFEAGCPTLLARASCFPEIAGDAAVYFDPKDKHELNESLIQILNNAEVRKRLKEKAAIRLSHFSWEQTYHETIKCYESIL